MLSKHFFTNLPDGRAVYRYRLTNRHGEYVDILDYGACLYRICVLDAQGRLGDVILGISDARELTAGRFAGATIGRCANRIAQGQFQLNGKTVQLERNQNGHHLHGGSGNYAHQLFHQIPGKEDALCLALEDTGAGGYDCPADVSVSFSFDDNHQLHIHYHMVSPQDTLLCPTNHAYFNLDGEGSVTDHRLQIHASRWAVKGPSGLPEGEIGDVAGTPLDFRQPKSIGEAFSHGEFFSRTPPELDDTFLLGSRDFRLAAELWGSQKGRRMQVYTDMPAIIAFTMYIREPTAGKDGQCYQGYQAIALETQYVPNAVNCPSFEAPVFPGGQALESHTIYAFDTLSPEEEFPWPIWC